MGMPAHVISVKASRPLGVVMCQLNVHSLLLSHLTETNVPSKICDMGGKAFPVDVRIPNSCHGPALDKKQKNLRKVTGRDETNEDPEEHIELLPCSVDKP